MDVRSCPQAPYHEDRARSIAFGQTAVCVWAMPAHTPEGRKAKVLVALNLLPDEWRDHDGMVEFGIGHTRQLLIEFVGGEPGNQLRDQFA